MKKIAIALIVAVLSAPISAFAESGDAEGVIKSIDPNKGLITLDDGKVYNTPSEFNFEGLEPGVKVVIYYSTDDGKRVVDDLLTQ